MHAKKNDESLQVKLARLENLIDNMVSGLALFDPQGRLMMHNKVAAHFFGGAPSAQIGRSIKDLFPKGGERYLERILQVVESGEAKFFESLVEFPLGPRWLMSIYQPVWDDTGQLYAIQITSTDITREKKIQEELLEARRFLIESQRIAKIGSWQWDLDTNQVIWSEEMFRILGLTPQEPNYGLVKGLLHPDDVAFLKNSATRALRENHPFQIDYRIIRPDGDLAWIHNEAEVIRDADGKALKMWGTAQDITARKLAEAAAKEGEAKYSLLFNLLSDPVFLLAEETGRILETNTVAEKCYGYRREELLAMHNNDLLADDVKGGTETALETEQIIPLRPHKKKDGTIFPVEINATHFLWQGQEVQLALIRDISFRIQAERQRADLETRLRQAQKMEAIGTLAGGIAHDFNNILSSIIGFAELALDDVAPDTVTHDNLNEVLVAGLRAKDLVHQILTFSRQSEQQMQPTQVESIVKEATRMLRATIPATIDLKVELSAENSTIFGDATQIHQVIMNLCTNAVHAMEENGGTLTIRLENVLIEAEQAAQFGEISPGPCLKLSVDDSGIGIPPEIFDRIFEPYMTTKVKGKGTGLGLAVVHGIVQSHQGHIVVRSHPQQGTTMEVYLPLLPRGERAAPPSAGALPKGDEHLLLVDDELQIVHMQRQTLERLGYTITFRTSSLDALELFKSNPQRFDAVITDMTMPHLTGDRLARQVKAIRPAIPVILSTGFSEKIGANTPLPEGIDRLLMKPVGKADLARTIRELLDQAKGKMAV